MTFNEWWENEDFKELTNDRDKLFASMGYDIGAKSESESHLRTIDEMNRIHKLKTELHIKFDRLRNQTIEECAVIAENTLGFTATQFGERCATAIRMLKENV